jgi:hypothetical protein
MWEEIVAADGNDGITITTKRIPPPPLVSWFPSVRTLHIGPKFIQGWESAEYKLPARSSAPFERVAMPNEVHQIVMDLLAVQPFERLEEVHFDCFYVDDVAPPLLDVLSTRFSESLKVLTLNEHSCLRRQMPSVKLVESLAKFPSLRVLHILWDKNCDHSPHFEIPGFMRELGIKVLGLSGRIPCLEELAMPLPLQHRVSSWEWDFSSFKQVTRLIFCERGVESDIFYGFLTKLKHSSEVSEEVGHAKAFISQMFGNIVVFLLLRNVFDVIAHRFPVKLTNSECLFQTKRPPQVGINIQIQLRSKDRVNKPPQIETALWDLALSRSEQCRSVIAGQDALRVLKEVHFGGLLRGHLPSQT